MSCLHDCALVHEVIWAEEPPAIADLRSGLRGGITELRVQ